MGVCPGFMHRLKAEKNQHSLLAGRSHVEKENRKLSMYLCFSHTHESDNQLLLLGRKVGEKVEKGQRS